LHKIDIITRYKSNPMDPEQNHRMTDLIHPKSDKFAADIRRGESQFQSKEAKHKQEGALKAGDKGREGKRHLRSACSLNPHQ
jgi:hypothetical protein